MAANRRRRAVLLWLMLCVGAPALGQRPQPFILDRPSLRRAATSLAELLSRAVRDRGGDLGNQHLRLVVAFSTGHFASDPVLAQATRELATLTAASLLVRGDRVRVYAWEIGVWPFSDWAGEDVIIKSDRWDAKYRQLAALWPLTPRTGSVGGHDTERAIGEIASDLAARGVAISDTVLLLLTPHAASMQPPGQRVLIWGQDDPRYLKTLRRLRLVRMPAVTKSGASAAFDFKAQVPEKGTVSGRIEAVVVLPAQFSGPPLSPPSRSERLAGTVHRQVRVAMGPWVLVAVFLLLLALLLAALTYTGRRRGWSVAHIFRPPDWVLQVEDHAIDLARVRLNEEICHLVGPDYEPLAESSIVITGRGNQPALPALCCARLWRVPGGVEIRAESGFRIDAVGDRPAMGRTCRIRYNQETTVTLAGQVPTGPGRPPRRIQREIRIALTHQ